MRSRVTRDDDFCRLGELLGSEYGSSSAADSPRPPGAGAPGLDGLRRPDAEAGVPDGGQTEPRCDPAKSLAEAWPELVGAEIAANAHPAQLNRGRLVVTTSSSAWAHTLQFMSERILTRLVEHLGEGVVDKVVFQHAHWQERSKTAAPRVGRTTTSRERETGPHVAPGAQAAPPAEERNRLSEEEAAVLLEVEELDIDPALRTVIERAIRAAFVRGERDNIR